MTGRVRARAWAEQEGRALGCPAGWARQGKGKRLEDGREMGQGQLTPCPGKRTTKDKPWLRALLRREACPQGLWAFDTSHAGVPCGCPSRARSSDLDGSGCTWEAGRRGDRDRKKETPNSSEPGRELLPGGLANRDNPVGAARGMLSKGWHRFPQMGSGYVQGREQPCEEWPGLENRQT